MTNNHHYNSIIQTLGGFAGLLLLGMSYAWSLFVGPLEAEFGWSRSDTSLTFSISMICFCTGGILGSIIKKKYSHRITFTLAAFFFLCGFGLCSRTAALPQLYIGYGVLCGLATGMSYNNIISTVTSWFPDKTGLISGILLMGYGLGSFILGFVITSLFSLVGWRNTYLVFAVCFFLLLLFLSRFLRPDLDAEDPQAPGVHETSLSTYGMLHTSLFYLYYTWGVIISTIGLSLIGHAALAAASLTEHSFFIVFVTGILSVSNGVFRIPAGMIYDRIGLKKLLLLLSSLALLGSFFLYGALAAKMALLLIPSYICIGCAYGGCCTCNSAFIKEYYGPEYYGMNFSLASSQGIIASMIGPFVISLIQTATGSYLWAFLCFIPLLFISVLLLIPMPGIQLWKKRMLSFDIK